MARGGRPRRNRPRSRFYRAVERAVLGLGMTVVAWFVERRLIEALKKGSVQPAPRTAAEADDFRGDTGPREGELSTTTKEVDDQSQRQQPSG